MARCHTTSPLAIEIGLDSVAGARWTRTGSVDSYAVEVLPPGALVPSAVETNIINAAALKSAFTGVCSTLRAKDESVALILPDPVIRVFVQHFDDFPRSKEEADPMLRWKLKKAYRLKSTKRSFPTCGNRPEKRG